MCNTFLDSSVLWVNGSFALFYTNGYVAWKFSVNVTSRRQFGVGTEFGPVVIKEIGKQGQEKVKEQSENVKQNKE